MTYKKRDKTFGAKPTSQRIFSGELDVKQMPFSGGLKQANLSDIVHKEEEESKTKRATFTLRPGGQTWVSGMRTSFNVNRFEDSPPEQVFAEIVLLEVQEFITVMYGTLLRFYLPVLAYD